MKYLLATLALFFPFMVSAQVYTHETMITCPIGFSCSKISTSTPEINTAIPTGYKELSGYYPSPVITPTPIVSKTTGGTEIVGSRVTKNVSGIPVGCTVYYGDGTSGHGGVSDVVCGD